MIKKISTLLGILFVLFLEGCGSTPSGNSGNKDDKNWTTVSKIDDLSGTWVSEDGITLVFPKKLDGKEYLHIIESTSDDSALWNAYAINNGVATRDLWDKRYAAACQIYGENYPIADENGTQKGIKFLQPTFLNKYNMKIQSRIEMLVAEDIIYKNLSLFSLSKDGKKLKQSGTFRFYSSKFKNEYIEERIFNLVIEE